MSIANPPRIVAGIRWMVGRDIPEVMRIETDAAPPRWDGNEMRQAMRQKNVVGLVAEVGVARVDKRDVVEKQIVIAGFAMYALERDGLEILKLAVSSYWQRNRIGAQIAFHLMGRLTRHNRTELVVVVPETNLTGQLFFRSLGFLATDVRRGHFEGEDGYRMVFQIEKESLRERSKNV